MADKLYGEFRKKRKELQRLRSIYKKRADRATEAKLFEFTYLSQLDDINLGYRVDKNGKIEEDNFSLAKFKASDQYHQKQLLIQAENKLKYLKSVLDNPMSSLRGMKDLIKKDLKLDRLAKLDMNSAAVRAKLSSFRNSPEGAYKHAKVVQIMEAIDARKDLKNDEKTTLKNLIRIRLSKREKVEYDGSYLEWDVDIEELLEDPKEFMKKLSQGIPNNILEELKAQASKLETTDKPSHLPW